MAQNTSIKLVIIIAGVLALTQILFMGGKQGKEIQRLNNETGILVNEVRSLESEKDALLDELGKTENDLKKIAATVPPAILVGFEDHEARLTSFIDFLQSPMVEELDLNFKISKKLEFERSPVPMHKASVVFDFSFYRLEQFEDITGFLLGQNAYPLQALNMSISRSEGNKTKGSLNAVYLIPAKLDLLAETEEKAL